MTKRAEGTQGTFLKSRISKMPEGYYSGDKPNPNLRAFVEAHIKAHSREIREEEYVPPLTTEIKVERSEPVFEMHTYWSKKPPSAIDQYMRHYTKEGELILDSFSGSGTTLVSALRLGRKAIGIDRSPAATFISSGYTYPFDVRKVDKAFDRFISILKNKLSYLYETKDLNGKPSTMIYIRWSARVKCPRCLEVVTFWEAAKAAKKALLDDCIICPNCFKRGVQEELSTRRGKLPPVPVEVMAQSNAGGKKSIRPFGSIPDDFTIQEKAEKLFKNIRRASVPIPRKAISLRLGANGYATVKEAMWPRAAIVLDAALDIISEWKDREEAHYLKFLVSSILVNFSVMYSDRDRGGQPSLGRLSPTPLAREINAIRAMESKHKRMLKGLYSQNLAAECMLSTQSATDLSDIHTNSIDYVFTDPPYGDKIDFWELNLLWEAWLGFENDWVKDEIIINPIQGKDRTIWLDLMKKAFSEIYRVLKPNRWLSLCYHDTSDGTWEDIKDIASEVGFIPDEADHAVTIGTSESRIHIAKREGVIKRDIVVNFRKPRFGESKTTTVITGSEDHKTFSEKVCGIISEILTSYPGSTKDRIYDEVISRMVRAGTIETHNFDALLNRVAEPAANEKERWFLKNAENVLDEAESALEKSAAGNIGRFISLYIKDHPELEGVHYSDIFEHYIYAVKAKPRRELQEWLLDYFYKTPDGTYRLALTEEEDRAKELVRSTGVYRQIKRHIISTQQGIHTAPKDIPSSRTIAEWIRQCKRAGLYEQGKFLYEKGGLNLDNLSEEAAVNAEEDYQVCVRLLARGTAGNGTKSTPKRGRKKP